ncbi:MAG TPA: NADH-quinone oxidoreductase subunit NuoH [Longimicrobium sp.]|jgi:NADH-quinone oxidoreductase subunit H|uniref:NADH-quinone oxidoreductase subunit NuoH n=1 Tax=Longimicrobium sp. TaxID=2029185 RepID=UPI002ED791AB
MQAGDAVGNLKELSADAYLVTSVIKLLIVFVAVLVIVAMLTLLERKISAWMQDRIGPNRVGPGGLLQPAADGLKNILKEESNPGEAHGVFFTLAPMLSIIPAMVTFAVIPLAAPLPTPWGVMPMMIADLPVGILFLMAFSSLGVYGIVMAGWASSNKYALLGGLRAGAQMISYEISLGLSLMSVFFLVGNVGLDEVVYTQQRMNLWFALPLSASFFFFWISAFAETNRLPFDLPEAESELVTGYHTEYSAMKFSMFFIAEYAHVLTQSMLLATLFLGGWDIPGLGRDDMLGFVNGQWVGTQPAWWITLLTLGAFLAKTFFFIMVFMLVRWTVPRFRYDQVMDLGWKIMLPVALAVVVVTAATVLALDSMGAPFVEVAANGARGYFTLWGGLVLTAVNGVMLMAVIWLMDKGHTLEGTGSMDTKRLAAQERARKRDEAMRIRLTTPRAGVR